MTQDIIELNRPAPPSRLKRLLRRFGPIFWLTVALPTLVATVYYGLIASDVYISEARFVVRSPERTGPTGLSALLAGAGISRSQDDTYTVQSYVLSRDALRELDAKAGLRKAYTSTDIDVFNRFPGLSWDRSFEALYEYYLEHVTAEYDPVSSITTLQVRAYTPEKAHEIDELLLEMSERLLNNLNIRSREDLISVARQEVSLAEARVKAASLALTSFRSKDQVFDPIRESAAQIDDAARLREELRVVETQVARLKQLAPANPQLETLNAQAATLRAQIERATAAVVGSGNSMASKSSTYERLVFEKEFSDKQLESAFASLEAARADAARKQLYLERLVLPNKPDMAGEPRRLRSILTVFVLGLLVWGVVSLLVAGVREHMD